MATPDLAVKHTATSSGAPTQSKASDSPIGTISPLSPNSTAVSIDLGVQALFPAIRALFDYLRDHSDDAAKLNAT
ncbi:hypothetical protein NUU61_006732 [Penicillium alfredii]|uniref:Uncharacterized protein n=1 Tax=Penicillium alfredii TaxID=1506179 RepID=A0A9W9K4J1_9EURO|nr:uncharacterized protein NUU61_006732 [Penicillium alfredii]KAJ5091862.1 hypothetical protein NUU61_006732 [Penicillium alfredii]